MLKKHRTFVCVPKDLDHIYSENPCKVFSFFPEKLPEIYPPPKKKILKKQRKMKVEPPTFFEFHLKPINTRRIKVVGCMLPL